MILTEKKTFKYYDDDGVVQTDTSLYHDQPKVLAEETYFYQSMGEYEAEWRNSELSATDYMLMSDATYGGVALAGSDELDDIMAYRTALRDYAYDTSEARPTRPVWYTG